MEMIKNYIRYFLAAIFIIVAINFGLSSIAMESEAKNAIHQILTAVYHCATLLSSIAAILLIRR